MMRLDRTEPATCGFFVAGFSSLGLTAGAFSFVAPDEELDMRIPTREDGLMELHKMKGYWKDNARVKIKLSTRQHWMFSFFGIQQQGRSWSVEAC